MKRWILIGTLLAAAFTTAAGQNHIERAMRRAREEREALARKTVVSDEGTAGAGYLTYRVENGDTTYFDSIDPVWIWGRGKGPQSEKQWRKYYKTVWRFAKVYPYALAAGRLQEIVDSTIAAGNYGRMKKDRYIAEVQKELFKDFEGGLRNMTISQGGDPAETDRPGDRPVFLLHHQDLQERGGGGILERHRPPVRQRPQRLLRPRRRGQGSRGTLPALARRHVPGSVLVDFLGRAPGCQNTSKVSDPAS